MQEVSKQFSYDETFESTRLLQGNISNSTLSLLVTIFMDAYTHSHLVNTGKTRCRRQCHTIMLIHFAPSFTHTYVRNSNGCNIF